MGYIVTPLVSPDTIWLARGPFPTGTAIGLHLGWFDHAFGRHGFKVLPLQDSRDATMRAQHFYHTIKTLIREAGNVHPIWRRSRNLFEGERDQTVVVGLTWQDETQVLLGRPGAGLRAHDPSSLKGKGLGLSKAPGEIDVWRAMALRAFDTALRKGELSFDDVALVDIAGPAVQWQRQRDPAASRLHIVEAALLRGEIDVIFAKGARAVLLQEQHGLEVVLDINSLDDPQDRINSGTPRPVTVHRHLLDDNPELVRTYLQVLNAAARWARSHADSVVEVIAAETATTVESVRRGYGPRLIDSFDINLNAARVDALQSQVDFLSHHRLIDARFDVADWIDTRPLLTAFAEPLSFA